MAKRLTVNSGETYTVNSGETEDWGGVTVDGTLDVQGTLELTDDGGGTGTPTGGDGDATDENAPIDLQISPLNLTSMDIGTSIFITAIMAIIIGAAAFFRNYAAAAVWGLALFTLIVSSLLGIGLEVFWSMVAGCILVLIAGMIMRWTA